MVLTNLVTIKNYEAGKAGHLLVSLDEKLNLSLKGEAGVDLLIAGVEVDELDLPKLQKYVDDKTGADVVIVVSKKFMRMPNKQQLALLAKENAKIQRLGLAICAEEADIVGDIVARKNFGLSGRIALWQEHNYTVKGEKKCVRQLKRLDKGKPANFTLFRTNKIKEEEYYDDLEDFFGDDDFKEVADDGADVNPAPAEG